MVNLLKYLIEQVEYGKYHKIYYIKWKVHKIMLEKYKLIKHKYVKY